MQVISIRWKDTDDKLYKDVIYRKKTIKRYRTGWVVDGDENIYHCIECVENKIDSISDKPPRRSNPKRLHHGITIVGKI